MKPWFKEYVKLFFEDREASYKLKHQNIPKKLYKYQPISDNNRESRLKALKDNKLWFSKAVALNDPFDCQPTCYNEEELRQFIKQKEIHKENGKTVDELLNH
ncbi:hypothetical protein [Saccharococcus caldoxylosilyticus]|uniref:hypothetical protein n=1 Tax=Saccharococcus caldoxylosilyticus TaxID=81408 RepID=UPI001C4DE79D|nr:hypothetical protein [Parageobacillus caldoxylosilyticus]QXJ39073.1 hypothetical protein BV455_02438 [Parageobacillus caldoxylosilyticus]BDG37238.1 hypothetical protein PcaKH15_31440 [Parageobacillus caldoxylosilyticus]BDG41029.1 hypothetical protein PcaKH16_31680 [Parageobacillus caldoxylosilyticus]BDG44780.1 hypothetical protein PcaKH35_31250 [Parageobacillus caldoxylosilyticus]